ncbi:MAG: hypothetical protein ACM3ZE_04510 [Myxococcales bacterium]
MGRQFLRATRVLHALASNQRIDPVSIEETISAGRERILRFATTVSVGPKLVLLHGVTARGCQDQRLTQLARALAHAGATCFVPHLTGLANFREDLADLIIVERAIGLAREQAVGSVSVLGFSLGGGYGLVCASQPALAGSIARIAVVGAHYRLEEVWARMSERLTGMRAKLEQANADDLYCALCCAAQRLGPSQLSTEAAAELKALLWEYCDQSELARVRNFVREQLSPHWGVIAACHSGANSEKLSPAGRLHRIQAAVRLLHAPDDGLVPKSHALRNYGELSARAGGQQTLLCTPLLDHVKPRLLSGWWHVPRLVECFAELLTRRD